MNKKSVIRRIGVNFNNEIDNIIEEREKANKKKMTKSEIIDKITKHNSWGLIKEELICY